MTSISTGLVIRAEVVVSPALKDKNVGAASAKDNLLTWVPGWTVFEGRAKDGVMPDCVEMTSPANSWAYDGGGVLP